MVRKLLIAAITITVSIIITGWTANRMKSHKPNITVKGLDEVGLKLKLAYPGKSWQEVVLTNDSEYHIIAAVLLYEITGEDDSKALARDVICHPQVSLENNPAKIKELLIKYPVLPPHSNWLAGVGIDRVQLINGLPPFNETRHLMSQEISLTSLPLKSARISIDGAILDNGQIVGPQTDNPKQWIMDIVKKFNEETP